MAPIVRRAFDLYSTGTYTVETLGAELKKLGLRNRNGRPVSRSRLSHLLNNPFYIGIIRIGRTNETFQGVHKPIVAKSVFDQVHAILHRRARNRGYKHDFRYRKLVRCASCRHFLIPEKQKGHAYYRCQNRNCPRICIREERIDEWLRSELAKLRMTEVEREMLWQEFQKLDVAMMRVEEIKAVNLALDSIRDRLERLTDALIDRIIDKERYDQRTERLLQERASLTERLDEIADGRTYLATKRDNFLELINTASIKDETISAEEIRRITQKAASNVLAEPNRVAFAWVSPYDVVVSTSDSSKGEPYRAGTRTITKRVKKIVDSLSGKNAEEPSRNTEN